MSKKPFIIEFPKLGESSVGYSDAQAKLRFVKAQAPYEPHSNDLYWKIALSVPNIELAFEQLHKAGVSCTEPHQFEDVGYLAHFSDPEGFKIELIDHAFKGERKGLPSNNTLLGGGAHLSLVTLRIAEIDDVEPTLLSWGMRKMSVQSLPAYGFNLHFFAFAEETPPEADLASVANRTWVYRRPYTVLELQHVFNLQKVNPPSQFSGGFDGLRITSQDVFPSLHELKISWDNEIES